MTTEQQIYNNIKEAINKAPRNKQTVEMHLQMIKYADELRNVTAKEFIEGVGLKPSFGTEFSKMRNLTDRLKAAGLDTSKL
ncbi:transcription factor [Cronobacter sakazakii]|nr:transcription factor [Cronobacter sakazakii]EJQ2917505.1 transcription factor [Cronobacter sakazakii]EJR0497823.1 transcription factor [Cronobacter sakazakii]